MSGQNAMRSEIRAKPSAAMDGAPLKLEQFLPYQLNVVAALVSEALSRVYARRYRIGIPEWRVLVTLGQFGVMTGKAIGTHTHMHKTKVSRAVALLEKRKLLARRINRADMRESFLSRGAGHLRRASAACARFRPPPDRDFDARRPRRVPTRFAADHRSIGATRCRSDRAERRQR
jgi:MarR family